MATLAKFEGEVATVSRDFPRTDLLVFPELYLTGEDPFSGPTPEGFLNRVAEPIPGPTTDRVAKVAAKAGRWIVAGSVMERSNESIYNTAIVVSPEGEVVACHRKLFPWRPWESVTRGDRSTLFEIGGVGKVGLLICYDGWFPETARGLALAGAELIIQVSLTATADRQEELVLARAAAIANQCYVLNVNSVTTIGGGRSIGIDPEGRVLFEGGTGEELILEVLDLDRVATVRSEGTRGLNRLMHHLEEAPGGVFEHYRRFLAD
jgi:formamidase